MAVSIDKPLSFAINKTQEINTVEIQKYDTILAGPSWLLETLNPKPAYSNQTEKSVFLLYLHFLQISIEHLICTRVESGE